MEALSDLKGTEGNVQTNIDFQDKETGTILFKGQYSLGFKNVFLGDGWNRFANFSMKIRCKDGRAQITMTVPTITAVYNRNGTKSEATVQQVYDEVLKARGNKRERGMALLDTMADMGTTLMEVVAKKMTEADDDDDF